MDRVLTTTKGDIEERERLMKVKLSEEIKEKRVPTGLWQTT